MNRNLNAPWWRRTSVPRACGDEPPEYLVSIDAGEDFAVCIFAHYCDPEEADLSLILAAPDLLAGLMAANQIIKNALNLMTPMQKEEWSRANQRDLVDGEGVTRCNKRDAAIAKAEGRAS